jgi:hypothetical protein
MGATMRTFNYYICDEKNINIKNVLEVKENERLYTAISNKLNESYALTEPLFFSEKQSNGKLTFIMTTKEQNIQVNVWEVVEARVF